jgi:hypothetical protein
MPTDQVESLTHERRDARRIIESLPIQSSQSVKDLIAQDPAVKENPVFTALSWLVYAVALGGLGWMTWEFFKT